MGALSVRMRRSSATTRFSLYSSRQTGTYDHSTAPSFQALNYALFTSSNLCRHETIYSHGMATQS